MCCKTLSVKNSRKRLKRRYGLKKSGKLSESLSLDTQIRAKEEAQRPRQWARLVMRNILNNDVDLLPLLMLLLLSSSVAIVVAVNCHAY